MDKILTQLFSVISELGTTLFNIAKNEKLSKEGTYFVDKTMEIVNKQLESVNQNLVDLKNEKEIDYTKLN